MKTSRLTVLKGGVMLLLGLLILGAGILLSSRVTRQILRPVQNHRSDPLRRALEVAISTAALTILLPAFVVISLLIRLTSPGPVFYMATRVGRNGQEFRLYKFRSMVTNADKSGPGITVAGDARVTPVGRILRRYKIDELPQLINVLKGDMSLVGPRPEDPRYVALYTPEQRHILSVRPGVTSLASIQFRSEENLLSGADWEQQYIQKIMPAKIALDMEYIQRANLLTDMKVILQTATAIAS